MLAALTNVPHRPSRLSWCTDGRQCLLGSDFISFLCVWSLLTWLYKKNQSGKQRLESGPYLPTPASTVLYLQPPYSQSRQGHPPVSGKAAVVIMRRAERRHKGHLVSKCGSMTTLQQDLLGSHWTCPSPDWNIAQRYSTGLTRVRSWVQFLAWEGMKESIRLPFQKT